MTTLQVEYNKLLETKRYNAEYLAELVRSHQASENITSWRNQQDINLGYANLALNQAKADTEALRVAEVERHNRESESLTAWSTAIQQTHYQNQDRIGQQNANTEQYRAQTDSKYKSAQIAQTYMSMEEQKRHNQAVESETHRTNVFNEYEKQRSNLANERTKYVQAAPPIVKAIGVITGIGTTTKNLDLVQVGGKTVGGSTHPSSAGKRRY